MEIIYLYISNSEFRLRITTAGSLHNISEALLEEFKIAIKRRLLCATCDLCTQNDIRNQFIYNLKPWCILVKFDKSYEAYLGYDPINRCSHLNPKQQNWRKVPLRQLDHYSNLERGRKYPPSDGTAIG